MVTITTTGQRKRGRPPTTSREAIVETAVGLVTSYPDKELSIHELARALKLSPTSLYGHIADKDELLQLVSTRLLERLTPVIIEDNPWQDQLESWAGAVRDHFLRYPAMVRLLGWPRHMSTAWMHHIAVLTRILKLSGLEKAELADAAFWVSRDLIGAIYIEIEERGSLFRIDKNDLQQLSADDRATWSEILRFLAGVDASQRYQAVIARVVSALERPGD